MRSPLQLAASALALSAATLAPAAAQIPSNLEPVELTRSRECVDVLRRLDVLDESLQPLAQRSQRLLAIGQAIALEDDSIIESLDPADSVEAAVRAWFETDAGLAARYVEQPSPEIQEERTAEREAIRATVTQALQAVQAEADEAIGATGDLQQRAGGCTGAVFVRSAVLESCSTGSGSVCEAARDSTAASGQYRFVESAASLWDIQELRAWTVPGPLGVTPNGQLGGARTIGATRVGNVAVTVAFGPWLQERDDLAPEAAERIGALTDSLGFGSAHPDLIYVPALTIRATLAESLGDESGYVFHFGTPEEADVVWTAVAGTGNAVEGIVPLTPSHLSRLQAGEPLTLTAVREADNGQADAVYAIELTSLNQSSAVSTLLGYMANQLAEDLAQLIPPDNS